MTIRVSHQVLLLLLAVIFFAPNVTAQSQPLIAFSDLISGPSEGLNDGKGEGAIVTVWAYHLSGTPGRVLITDSAGVTRQAAHTYYWKRADGQGPSGPADLYSSHQLYEVSFSLPKSANGPAVIHIENDNGIASPPFSFTVRAGNIYHVKASGSNDTGDGTFTNPWRYLNGWHSNSKAPGNGRLQAGDLVYSHGVTEPSYGGGGRDSGLFLRSINGTLSNQVALVAYPNTRPIVRSPRWGIHPYLSSGIVVSKFSVYGGLLDDPRDNSLTFGAGSTSDSTMQIKTSSNGRIIGNYISDIEGKCSNGWHGGIVSGGIDGSNVKVFGNHIDDLGCIQTSHFHHTTYMTKRTANGSEPTLAWEFAYNRLTNNKARYGIHFYDQSPFDSTQCDHVVGTLRVYKNHISNQRGPGINVVTRDHSRNKSCWETDVEIVGNILVNTGLGPVAEINNGTAPYAIKLGGAINGSFFIANNLIEKVSDASSREYAAPAVISITDQIIPKGIVLVNNIISTDFIMQAVIGNSEITTNNNIWNISELPDGHSAYQVIDGDEVLNFSIETNLDQIVVPESIALRSAPAVEGFNSDFYGRSLYASGIIGPVKGSTASPPSPPFDVKIENP
ncbi:MAG: hypothetical protein LAT63_11465 [Marinobacter sp.]|nr:hypothetical protein [Marinobacter sp.]